MSAKVLPTAMMLMELASAIGYAFSGDMRRTVYWLACAVLTASITY